MLVANNLFKKFSGKPALADVSFHVQRGEIYGLLGHNGAGKSTSLGIILGMVLPDRGDVTIGGISVLKDRSKALRKVGAIFEAPAFYDYLSGWDNLKILMSYSGGFDATASSPGGATTNFNDDILFSNGVFLQYPEGVQTQ